jgi:hypothetical protein
MIFVEQYDCSGVHSVKGEVKQTSDQKRKAQRAKGS